MKDNFERFQEMLLDFFGQNGVNISINPISLHEASKNDADKHHITYFYNGEEMPVLDMDEIAKKPYRKVRVSEEFEDTKDDIVNTADGFVINKDNQWFLIEFKDTKIAGTKKSLKDNIIKKAYCNWYMLMDILLNIAPEKRYSGFDYSNPVKFAKENVVYILVCNSNNNPNVVNQIRNHRLKKEKYTPIFMQRLKEYVFMDAYVYTEIELEREFVKKFEY